MLSSLAERLSLRDLNGPETLAAIEMAEKRSIQGARIHDLLHARAAVLAGAEKILTRDGAFRTLGESIETEWP
jgi:hypothetical protein